MDAGVFLADPASDGEVSMARIWKYPLPIADYFELEMPRGAHYLSVQVQHEQPMLWALVDEHEPKQKHPFSIHGTGHQVDDAPDQYVGTFQTMRGEFIWHLFTTQLKGKQ